MFSLCRTTDNSTSGSTVAPTQSANVTGTTAPSSTSCKWALFDTFPGSAPRCTENDGNLFFVLFFAFLHSWKRHANHPDHARPSQEHVRRRELHRWNSADPGPAGRLLLHLQVLQVQGSQLPHPLKRPLTFGSDPPPHSPACNGLKQCFQALDL